MFLTLSKMTKYHFRSVGSPFNRSIGYSFAKSWRLVFHENAFCLFPSNHFCGVGFHIVIIMIQMLLPLLLFSTLLPLLHFLLVYPLPIARAHCLSGVFVFALYYLQIIPLLLDARSSLVTKNVSSFLGYIKVGTEQEGGIQLCVCVSNRRQEVTSVLFTPLHHPPLSSICSVCGTSVTMTEGIPSNFQSRLLACLSICA